MKVWREEDPERQSEQTVDQDSVERATSTETEQEGIHQDEETSQENEPEGEQDGEEPDIDKESDVEVESAAERETEEPHASTTTGPPDISRCRDDAPVQPRLKLYPRTLMEDRRRSFKSEWYNIHPWLEYSK
ncbi:hypothetical protein LDENG_00224430, partial [Lucifuga dentata]